MQDSATSCRYIQVDFDRASQAYSAIIGSKNQPKGRILVAEDDRIFAGILRDALIEEGYQVDIAHNGRESLRLIHQNKYDLASMDIVMPYVGGVHAIIAMESVRPGIPVLVLSGNLDTETLSDLSLCSNVKGCLDKPVDIGQYMESVRAIVSSIRQKPRT